MVPMQSLHDLALDLGAHLGVHFAPHVAGHLLPKGRKAAFLEAHGLNERIVDGRQFGLLDRLRSQLEAEGAPAQALVLVVFGKGDVEALGLPSRHARQGVLEVLQQIGFAQHEARPLPTVELLAVEAAFIVRRQSVALLRRALHGAPGSALPTQGLQHLVHIRIGDLRLRALDFEAGEVRKLHLRQDFKAGGELKVRAGVHVAHLKARRPGRPKLLLRHGFAVAGAHQLLRRLGPGGPPEAAAHLLQRHLAGAEARQANLVLGVLQAAVDLLLKFLIGNADGQPALHAGQFLH